MDCIFCQIANHTAPANIVYEDEDVIAFHDIKPQAPVHILIIPKQHISTMNDLNEEQAYLSGKLLLTASQLAKELNLAEKGYRVTMNCNQDGGQTVYHIHLHLLAGRQMRWPPG